MIDHVIVEIEKSLIHNKVLITLALVYSKVLPSYISTLFFFF